MNTSEINNIIIQCLLQYQPQKIGIFGSYSRSENTENSDIDILVKFKNSISLLQLLKIENSISEKIHIKVDLVTEGAITNQIIKNSIERDIKIIYNE